MIDEGGRFLRIGGAVNSVEVDLKGLGNVANVMLRLGTLGSFFFGDGRVWESVRVSRFVIAALECDRAETGVIGEQGSSTHVPESTLAIGWLNPN